MFDFRIIRIKVANNREKKSFLGILGKDLAEVQILSFVSTGTEQLPNLTDFISSTDDAKKKAMLESMVGSMISNRMLTETQNVKDNSYIPFADTGYSLYRADNIPDFLDWQLLVIESDKHTRDNAALIQNIVQHKDFGTFANDLGTLLKTAGNPAFAASVSIAKFAVKTITELVKNDRDDMIGQIYASFNRAEDYPDGKRNAKDVLDMTQNIMVDYSLFGN